MARGEQLYDLMLMLSSEIDDDGRDQVLDQIRSIIENGGGRIESQHDWGLRAMTFEIAHRGEAEYHLFKFYGPPAVHDELRRRLRIADGVVRLRIIKVLPGTPPPPEVRLAPAAEY